MIVFNLCLLFSFSIMCYGHIVENDLDTITRHEFLRSSFTVKVNRKQIDSTLVKFFVQISNFYTLQMYGELRELSSISHSIWFLWHRGWTKIQICLDRYLNAPLGITTCIPAYSLMPTLLSWAIWVGLLEVLWLITEPTSGLKKTIMLQEVN